MDVPVLNMQGEQVGTMAVDEQSLGGVVNPPLLKQAYVRYHANLRQGSARTKNRKLVAGSGRKLYRQKGTGNARMGSVRTNIRRGGGRAFGKQKMHDEYRLGMPIKMRRLANRNALLAKLVDGEVKVIDSLGFPDEKTKRFKDLLDACGVDRTCLAALHPDNLNARLSARNLPHITICSSEQLTCWDMLNSRYMIIAKDDLEAWLGGPGGVTDKRYARGAARGGGRVMESTHIIKKPLLTEKHTYWSNEANRYAFLVDRRATKADVKRAIEDLYRVKVLGVNTQMRKGGSRRTRFGYILNKPEKHAIIKVHPDDRIELF